MAGAAIFETFFESFSEAVRISPVSSKLVVRRYQEGKALKSQLF